LFAFLLETVDMTSRLLLGFILLSGFTPCLLADGPSRTVEFNRDIRPILSDNCFVCHGPDNNLRKAKLRLDLDKGLYADNDGVRILVPGKPAESELFKRLTHAERSQRMPPAKSNKELTPAQIELVKLWIEQGAKYQGHWSLLPPVKLAAAEVKNKAWTSSPIDHFILARLEKEGLAPTKEADRRTLIRRLSFDLIGLPPSLAQVDAFVNDKSPAAYEKLVDTLLKSPHHGERMALYWLDLVRYADTAGYHSDNHRDVYLYRDWVIDAFNRNVPFDQFATDQIAGDLVPKATAEQRIASGYNRLLQTTEEGGAQAKEYQAKYYADRVRNFSTVFMGMTLGCCECHDHKFDPFATKEFYKLEAFFADIQEASVGRQGQTPIPPTAQTEKVKKLDVDLAALKDEIAKLAPQVEKAQAKWEEEVRGKANKNVPKDIAAIIAVTPAKRNAKQKETLTHYYRKIDPASAKPQAALDALQAQRDALAKTVPTTLVSTAGPPRTVRVLPRGNWLDETGEIVLPGTPASLPKLDVNGRRANRHDLAQWLVAKENPLTARVFVNRLWMLCFGQGIVKTLDDFGAQGAWPTHPELLDWLALEFQEKGWDVRHMIKLMVLSNTYRQASTVSDELKQRDPLNYLHARQARHRLEAEMIRDNALAISGLLSSKIGGPSVKPYQPAGYWSFLNFPTRDWQKDTGDNQYRRGLYTYWQRTFLHPSLLAFDASSREECSVERPRSNTPQQALVLLNDPTYVEAARVFAQNIIKKGGETKENRVAYAIREALQRDARRDEVILLANLFERHFKQYQADDKAAQALIRVGDSPVPADIAPAELAAWTSVARVIMNLHEAITRY